MDLLNDSKKIVCALPEGRALELVRRLHKDKGIESANIHRGRGRSTSVRKGQTFGAYTEVEVVTVIVEKERAEEIFEFMYFAAELDHKYGGFIYQVPVVKSTVFKLPEIPEEDDNE